MTDFLSVQVADLITRLKIQYPADKGATKVVVERAIIDEAITVIQLLHNEMRRHEYNDLKVLAALERFSAQLDVANNHLHNLANPPQ